MSAAPKCPVCGRLLQKVIIRSAYFNDDQVDAIRAGDYYCDSCKGTRGNAGYRYYWRQEVITKEGDAHAGRETARSELQVRRADMTPPPGSPGAGGVQVKRPGMIEEERPRVARPQPSREVIAKAIHDLDEACGCHHYDTCEFVPYCFAYADAVLALFGAGPAAGDAKGEVR